MKYEPQHLSLGFGKMKIRKYIILIYTKIEGIKEPWLLTWHICNTFEEIEKFHRGCVDFDTDMDFTRYSYKWIALELTNENK